MLNIQFTEPSTNNFMPHFPALSCYNGYLHKKKKKKKETSGVKYSLYTLSC